MKRCITRAMKNAKYLQRIAPHIIQREEPLKGFGSIIPLSLLAKIHTIDHKSNELKSHRSITEFLEKNTLPAVRSSPSGSLFNGTVYFVQLKFNTSDGIVSVTDDDMRTIINYALRAIIPIPKYTSQYGNSNASISKNVISYQVTIQDNTYNDQMLQGWINDIARRNSLSSNSCIFIVNPKGISNSNDTDGNSGYHDYAHSINLPYIFLNVFENGITVKDPNDSFAMGVSHEIAEMVVDPNVDHVNPEVSDPCDENCHVLYRHYFDNNDNYISTTEALPPPFDYAYYIAGIVSPDSANLCPAPPNACNFPPPNH
jgi:hypothetical protein